MSANKAEGQVTLTQMLKALDKDVAAGVEKRLKKLSKKKALQKPLDKTKAEQVERRAAYSASSKEVSKWEPIVDRNRKATQLKFPLDQEPNVLPTTAEAIGQLKPTNELEREVNNVIGSSETVLHDNKELSKAEEKYLKAISVEEAQARHKELQKMRVLLSSYAAKMRRQKLIKSKSYRRLLKHDKIRKHVKKVESDKDLLIEEIERLQKLRARERASLKHKNTGKWAKHAKFRAKYDDAARKAMLEQIGLAEKFLQKPAGVDSDDSDEEDIDDEDDVSVSDESSVDEKDTKASDNMMTTDSNTDRLIVSTELINDKLSRKRRSSQGGNAGESDIDMDDEEAEDDDEEDDQRKLMSEAFADDDVVAEFQREKDKMADEEQPKDVDTYLPGWGDWAGPGIKIDRRKRKKYIIKAKKIPRRDDKLGNVIISEQADDKMKELMIKKLPHHIKSEKRLGKIIGQPISATFVNQSVHRESIKQRVETKMGARIEPLNQKMLQGNKAKWA